MMPSLSLMVTFPLPPDELRANRRMGGHWGPVHKAKSAYELACRACILAAKEKGLKTPSPGSYPLHVYLEMYLGKGQRCDPTDAGAWTKSVWDSLVYMEIWPGDSAAVINPFTVEVHRDAVTPRLEIWW